MREGALEESTQHSGGMHVQESQRERESSTFKSREVWRKQADESLPLKVKNGLYFFFARQHSGTPVKSAGSLRARSELELRLKIAMYQK